MRFFLMMAIVLTSLQSCTSAEKADLLVYNATIYTVDDTFSKADALVIRGGKILAIGSRQALEAKYKLAETLDAGGAFIYPGFIDAHAHFVGYANGLGEVNLDAAAGWEEVLERCKKFAAGQSPDGWLIGRGWDQNRWSVKEFPDNEALSRLFPDRPVFLVRIDGHAAIANKKALELAGISAGDQVIGGSFEQKNGKLTGLLIDNAKDRVSDHIPAPGLTETTKLLTRAQDNCFAVGLTTIDDCGLDFPVVKMIDSLQRNGTLKMRLYAMLSDNKPNYDWLKKNGILKTDHLNVRSIKLYGDGALGSRGACLLKDYSDKPGWKGFLLSDATHFDDAAREIAANGWQMCTHAIGDSANRELLKIYAAHLKGKNDLRWRIEHAQVVDPADFHFFGDYSIIPSVQPTHATSDMYWAVTRLGSERIKSAYAYRDLMQQNQWIPLGTDFPVEDISPFKTFYAAVARKDDAGKPQAGFQPENALTREQAIRGMTIWAARANFEEKEKGSLEPGKWADFVILDQDLMKIPENEILKTRVLKTFLGGEKVYELKQNK